MKFSTTAAVACATTALAAPSHEKRQGCSSAVTLDASTNVFSKYKLHANTFYRSEVNNASAAISDATLAAAAKKVADVGTFLWM